MTFRLLTRSLMMVLVLVGTGVLHAQEEGVTEQKIRQTFQESPKRAIKKLGEADVQVQLTFLPRLLEALKSRDWKTRTRGTKRLVTLGKAKPDPVVKKILSFLQKQVEKKREELQVHVIRIIGDIGSPAKQAVSHLRKCLNSPYSAVRIESALSLGKIGSPAKKAAPDLVKLTHSKQRHLRWFAWNALNEILSKKELVRFLPRITRTPDQELSGLAIQRLVRTGDKITIPSEAIFALLDGQKLSDKIFLDMVKNLRRRESGVKVTVPLLTDRGVFLSGVLAEGADVTPDAGKNGAYQFSGLRAKGKNVVRLGSIPFLQNADSFTVSFWLKPARLQKKNVKKKGVEVEQVIFERGSAEKKSLQITLQNSSFSVFLETNEKTGALDQKVEIKKEQWHHVALTYDQNRSYETWLYIDGEIAKAWDDWGGELTSNKGAITQIGNNREGTAPFTGLISDVYLLERGFDTDLVKKLKGDPPGAVQEKNQE